MRVVENGVGRGLRTEGGGDGIWAAHLVARDSQAGGSLPSSSRSPVWVLELLAKLLNPAIPTSPSPGVSDSISLARAPKHSNF